MELNCPICQKPLERNGDIAHCETCDKISLSRHCALIAISLCRYSKPAVR